MTLLASNAMSENVEGELMEQARYERPLDEARAWDLCMALAARARAGRPATRDDLEESALSPAAQLPARVAAMIELYLPLCLPVNSVYAHVGQSLDGQIATQSGASRYVSGPENLRHMHRLRALADAVLVGASTVLHDDPQLTTRLVPGPSPTRVVIDPTLRLPEQRKVFHDQAAPTLVICARGRLNGHRLGSSEILEIEAEDGLLPPRAIVAALAARGLKRLFIEGGGVTVSRFLQARALDRLHVTICPILIGRGRPGISLPGVDRLDRALRPRTRRFEQEDDVLFDCQF
jgi:diaminohydroxyphosphoribosylaminopyrimidine deaminase / 5-amino-6-(5-phosphoribosylamino)uracil reductase